MNTSDLMPPWWKNGPPSFAATRSATAAATWVFPYYLAVAHAILPVAILRGPTRPSGRPGSIAVAGKDPWARYLPERVFLEPPRREVVGSLPVWSLARELRRLQSSVDLVVARVDTLSARRCFGSEFLHVPEWVGTWLQIPQGTEPLARATRSLRDDLRVVRNSRVRPRLSRQEAGFEEFYRHMYLPFIRNRHGEFSHPHGYHSLRRAFRHGGLLWAERDGQRIAGALFETSGDVLHFRALGTAGGDPALMKRGGLAALYGFMVDHARAQGCTRVELGTSRALLQDGVLRYKRKWGAVLADRADTRFELLLGWNRLDGAALDACASTSPIFRGSAGLAAVHVLDTHRPATSADAEEAHRAVWIPGLHRLCLVSTAGWQPDATGPPDTVLANPREAQPLLLGRGVADG